MMDHLWVYEGVREGHALVLNSVGPADLHASMGYTGETANDAVVPLIEDALRRIRRAGKAPGILTADEGLARRYLAAGALFTAVGSDVGLLARESDKLAARFRTPA